MSMIKRTNDVHDHILIIGGTGMLREASIALAKRCKVLSSVARTEHSLKAVDQATANAGVVHHLLALNWNEPATFLDSLVQHVNHVGRPSMVLAWLHQDELGPRIARAVAPTNGSTCEFFQVRGSAAADPAANAASLVPGDTAPRGLSFHQVILGFHVSANGARWLRNSEISAAVLAAIDRPKAITIVGTATPWSARP